MDDELSADVAEWVLQEYIIIPFYMAYIYYCITTLDEEVEKIWSQIRRVGSVLYMITKYSMIVCIVIDLLANYRLYLTIDNTICEGFQIALDFIFQISANSAEASMLLCLYALLGAKRRYLVLLVTVFVMFLLASVSLSLLTIVLGKGEPLTDLDQELGYACGLPPDPYLSKYYLASVMTSLSRTALYATLAVTTFFVRYRKQNGPLISVIRRDGGLYYLAVIVIRLVSAIFGIPSLSVQDKYYILNAISGLVIPIFANRLLLNMRKVDDPGTQHVFSSLKFGGGYDAENSQSVNVRELETVGIGGSLSQSALKSKRGDDEHQ